VSLAGSNYAVTYHKPRNSPFRRSIEHRFQLS
jgi:hypothetical protein